MKIRYIGLVAAIVTAYFFIMGGMPMTLQLSSSAFKNGEFIPGKYTGKGPDVSPPLSWAGVPGGTKNFALICDDPDAPMGTWVHWVIYNIPAETISFEEDVPKGDVLSNGINQGKNDFGKFGYAGPMPPPGKAHRYFFKLYALDTVLDLPAGLTKKELLKKIEGHILAEAQLMGLYKR